MTEGSPASRFLPIGVKLAAGMIVVLLAVSVGVFFELSRREHERLVDAKRTAVEMVAELFSAALSAPLDFGDEQAIETEIRTLSSSRDLEAAAVFGPESSKPMSSWGPGGDLLRPPDNRKTPMTRALPDRIEVYRPVAGQGGKLLGGAVVQYSLARENATYAGTRNRLLVFTLLMALGMAGVLFAVAQWQIVRPLARLRDASQRLASGERRARVLSRANDEIGQLAAAFNAMAQSIAEREESLAAARRDLQEVLDNTGQAIVVAGPDGRLLGACSRAASDLLGGSADGRGLAELLYPGKSSREEPVRGLLEWVRMAADCESERWPELADLAPRETVFQTPKGPMHLSLAFRPITSDGRVRRVMLVGTDVTEARLLAETVERNEREHARQLALARMRRDLEIAASIQLQLLPPRPSHPDFEFAGRMVPAEEVGGDFFDVLTEPQAQSLWITIGDVSSHGLGAGLVMLLAQSSFASLFRANPAAVPQDVLRCVNSTLRESIVDRLKDNKYVTAQLLSYRGNGRFSCVGAHQWPLVLRARTGRTEYLQAEGPWLGIVTAFPSVPEIEIQLEPGDVLCLYSDGLTEARNDSGELYDQIRLAEALQRASGPEADLNSVADSMLREVEAFSGILDDDRTLLLVRRKA